MTKRYLNRRLFLRGTLAAGGALALPLPILEGMLIATARRTPPAKRSPSAT